MINTKIIGTVFEKIPLKLSFVKYMVFFLVFFTPFVVIISWLTNYSVFSKSWHNLLVLIIGLYIASVGVIKKSQIQINFIDKIVVVSLVWCIFLMITTYLRTGSVFRMFQGFRLFYFGTIIYYVIRKSFRSINDIKLFIGIIHIVIVIICAELILEYFLLATGQGFSMIPWAFETYNEIYPEGGYNKGSGISGFFRPMGIMFTVESTGQIILVGCLLSMADILGKNKGVSSKIRIMGYITFFVEFVSIFLSTSKRSIISFMFLSSLITLRYGSFKKFLGFTFVSVMLILMLVINLGNYREAMFEYYSNSFTQKEYLSFYTNVFSIENFINRITKKTDILSFLIGEGFSHTSAETKATGESDDQVGSETEEEYGLIDHIINQFKQFGLIGVIIFVFLNLTTIREAFFLSKHETDMKLNAIYTGSAFVVCSFLIAGITNNFIAHVGIHYIYYSFLAIMATALELNGGRFKPAMS